jgi:hypothetical protein
MAPAERARSEQSLAAARAGSDDAAWAAAWAAGLAMSPDQAITEALAALTPAAEAQTSGPRGAPSAQSYSGQTQHP